MAPDSIMTFDLRGVITSCNSASARLSGYSKDELVVKHFSELEVLLADNISEFMTILDTAETEDLPRSFEVTWKHKDGTPQIGEVRTSLMKENSKTIGFQAIMRDVTEQRKTSKKLEQSERKFRIAVENNPDFMVFAKKDGTIFDVNRVAKGYKKERVIGQSILSKDWYETRDQAIKARKTINYVCNIICPLNL